MMGAGIRCSTGDWDEGGWVEFEDCRCEVKGISWGVR